MTSRIAKYLRLIALTSVPALLILNACGDDDTATPVVTPDAGNDANNAADGNNAATGTITGTVVYTGAPKSGSLNIAAFKTFPPAAGALPDTFTAVPTPAFPQTFELKNVPTGKITLTAYIDQFGTRSTPSATDPQGVTSVEVTAGATATATITLIERPAGDAGADADASR